MITYLTSSPVVVDLNQEPRFPYNALSFFFDPNIMTKIIKNIFAKESPSSLCLISGYLLFGGHVPQ